MGVQQAVRFEGKTIPSWDAVSACLARRHFPVQMRMIDGELAFPDEQPPQTWRELRVGTPAGMVTVRREADQLVFVTWGNADEALRQVWNALTWAFAEVGGGTVLSTEGAQTADEFRHRASLPPAL